MPRHFLRCPRCLESWYADVEYVERHPDQFSDTARRVVYRIQESVRPYLEAGCPHGCGAAEDVGAVTASGAIRKAEGVKCECDTSCAHARGARCDCSCGGANHGAGIMAYYVVWVDAGTTKARMDRKPKTTAKAVERGADWGAALDRLAAAVERLRAEQAALDGKRLATRLPEGEWHRLREIGDVLRLARRAQSLRTHKGRMAAVGKVEAATAAGKPVESAFARLRSWARQHRDVLPLLKGQAGLVPSFREQLRARQSLSARQVELLREQAARRVAKCPSGRLDLEARVVSVRRDEGQMGDVYKMLVEVTTPDGAFRLWSTIPAALMDASAKTGGFESLAGRRVRLRGTVEPSDKDEGFGFVRRPSKGELVEA